MKNQVMSNENTQELIEALGATKETWMNELSTIFSKDVFDEDEESGLKKDDECFDLSVNADLDIEQPLSPKINRSRKTRRRKHTIDVHTETPTVDLQNVKQDDLQNVKQEENMLEEIAQIMENETKNNYEKIENNVLNNRNSSAIHDKKYCGFQTASFKEIKTSEIAKKKAAAVFSKIDEITELEMRLINEVHEQADKLKSASFSGKKSVEESSEDVATDSSNTKCKQLVNIPPMKTFEGSSTQNMKENFCGFKTASLKNIKVSETAQNKAATIFSEIEKNMKQETIKNEDNKTELETKPLSLNPKVNEYSSPRPLVARKAYQNNYKTPTSSDNLLSTGISPLPASRPQKRRNSFFKPPRSVKKKTE